MAEGEATPTPDQGPEGEVWASWLVQNREEVEAIKKPELKTEIRLLARRPASMVTQDVLIRSYDRIDELLSEGVISDEEAILWQSRITSRFEKVAEERVEGGGIEQMVGKIGEAIKKGQIDATQQQLSSYQDLLMGRADIFGRSPESERANWVDLEYRQEFYARFEPRSWPRFYERASVDERRLWDARWELARAAFFKRAALPFPDKYIENQDLSLLSKEHMQRLYNMYGVRPMLEKYADVITNNREFDIDGKKITFWDIKDRNLFESMRMAIRDEVFGPLEAGPGQGDEIGSRIASEELRRKEADAVAWNLMWVSLLVESADSRYGFSGERHVLPGSLVADEYRGALHPQERFESKSAVGQFWGAFGNWGVTQMERIGNEVGNRIGKEMFRYQFIPAKKTENWSHKITDELDAEGKRIVEVRVPECAPVTLAGSFWEFHEVGQADRRALLDYLRKKDEIPWDDHGLREDMWAIYVAAHFNKAVQGLEYFNPGKPIELGDYGWAMTWAKPFIETMRTRLKVDKRLEKLGRERTLQTPHNLNVWAIYAATGGVKDVNRVAPELNLNLGEKGRIARVLAHPKIRYLDRKKGLQLE